MLGHDAVKHGGDAVDGHVGVAHPQDSVKLGEDEGHGRQRGGLGKHLDDWNTPNLQRRRQKMSEKSKILLFSFRPAAKALNSPRPRLR